MIEGVLQTPLRRIEHPKGAVLHALKRSAPGYVGFGEAYFSNVLAGEVKGWKRHRRVTLNFVVPIGQIRFTLHDRRPGSATEVNCDALTLGSDHYARLTIPPGIWVAFGGLHPGSSLLLNIADEEHDPQEAENADLGAFEFRW
jgi:dTDP-4-dehydrorhamnose 3,5-epimerase